MVFAKAKWNFCDKTTSVIYENEKDMIADAKKHDVSILFMLPFTIHGKTYSERRESLRDLAIDFQANNDGDTTYQLSMYECGMASDYFERNGKKYGLLREFRENCIC